MDFVNNSIESLSFKTLPSTQSIETVDTSTSDSTPVVFSALDPSQGSKDSDLDSEPESTAPSQRSFDELPISDSTEHPKATTLKRGRDDPASPNVSDNGPERSDAILSDPEPVQTKAPQEQLPESRSRGSNWVAAKEQSTVKQTQNATKRARVDCEPKDSTTQPPRPRHFPLNPKFRPMSTMPLDPDLEDEKIQIDLEYLDDHIKNFLKKEDQYKCQVDYIAHQPDLRWADRATLVTWMINLVHKFHLLPSTIYLATNLFDRFLSLRLASRSRVPYTALACAFIATKYETRLHPRPEQFIASCGMPISKEDLAVYEEYVLRVLDYRLGYPNPFQFLRYASIGDGCHLTSRLMSRYLMEQCLPSNTFVHCSGSLLACAAMHISRKILGRGSWNEEMFKYSHCGREEVVRTAKHMIDFLLLETTVEGSREKYSSTEYHQVAVIAKEWIAQRRRMVSNVLAPRA